MLSRIAQNTTSQIAGELRKTFEPTSAGGHPFPGSAPRVGLVEAWLDLRRRADGPTRRKIDDAIQQALTAALSDSAIESEAVCAHLRMLRLALQEGTNVGKVHADAKDAILGAIQSERYKGALTSYGDTHAELLACVEAFCLAPNYEFWLIQMQDTGYVSHAVSGCLGSGDEQWALNAVIQAAILKDRSLALALMRLLRMFQTRASLVWGRFGEARRNGTWSQEVFDRVSRSMAQIGQSCPLDAALAFEQESAALQELSQAQDEKIASLRQQLRARDQLLEEAKENENLAVKKQYRSRLKLTLYLDQLDASEQQYAQQRGRIFRKIERIAQAKNRDVEESRIPIGQAEPSKPEDTEKTWLTWPMLTEPSSIDDPDWNPPDSKTQFALHWPPKDTQLK